jgi:hypothetical protein
MPSEQKCNSILKASGDAAGLGKAFTLAVNLTALPATRLAGGT